MSQLLRSPRILVTMWNGAWHCSLSLHMHSMAA